jgi:hypothetical protein
MGEMREHIRNKRRASSCLISESHVEKLQRDHPDPNSIPLCVLKQEAFKKSKGALDYLLIGANKLLNVHWSFSC